MSLRTTLRHALITAAALAAAGVIGALLFVFSGVYSIAASEPHLPTTRFILTNLQRHSVEAHAEHLEVPPLDDPALVREGLVLYREYCVVCHGAPGESREVIGLGMNPSPPPLVSASREWTDAEIYWIITRGLKMAGMPSFDFGTDPRQAWALTAFVGRMRTMSTLDYQRMIAAVEGRADSGGVAWLPGEGGWAELAAAGNGDRGAELVATLGCGSCHVVPGVPAARGKVGAPLDAWARRHYIAGLLPNTPEHLVQWLVDPQSIEPGTAMPSVGATREQALDIAAYLYTLR